MTCKDMACIESCQLKPSRLGLIEGIDGKKNEVLYHPPSSSNPIGYMIFFGGDIQDYKENMLKHRDNKYYVQWHLESTCCLLHQRFPDYEIIIIKPSKMALMTFSCYEHFTQVNDFGAPTYLKSSDPLKHLRALMINVETSVRSSKIYLPKETESEEGVRKPLKLIGFSKGCVVLNQFLYSFLAVKEEADAVLHSFVGRVSDLYWLEGGHTGESEIYITNGSVLQNFASLQKRVHVYLTPFQICEERPRNEAEEKKFRKTLIKLGCNVKREFHFAEEPRSLENHFKVLEVFK